MSDDQRYGLTVIAMLGNVFSPFYARARTVSGLLVDPLDFCAMNVALYNLQGGGGLWALQERSHRAVHAQPRSLAIGKSSWEWVGDSLVVHLEEIASPIPRRIAGTIRLHPTAVLNEVIALDATGEHLWRPYVPRARVEVHLKSPAIRWAGSGYCDSNAGDAPLENAFEAWTWSRAMVPGTQTVLAYDVQLRGGGSRHVVRRVDAQGRVKGLSNLCWSALPTTRWGLHRAVRANQPKAARLLHTLEDTPFYARTLIDASVCGSRATIMHEVVSLTRFQAPWVRFLVPFRMRRSTP